VLRNKGVFLGLVAGISSVLVGMCSVQPAGAVTPAPHLVLHSVATPSVFSVADNTLECRVTSCDSFEVTATNSGSRAAQGPVVLTDELPSNLIVKRVTLNVFGPTAPTEEEVGTCESATQPVTCEYSGELLPDHTLQMVIFIEVNPGAVSGEETNATASAHYENSLGETVPLSASTTEDDLLETTVPFGSDGFTALAAGLDGLPNTQAGGHPYEFSTRVDLKSKVRSAPEQSFLPTSVEDLKDVVIDLPPGFLGSAVAAPKCTFSELSSVRGCPANTVVGQILTQPEGSLLQAHTLVYNMVPEQRVAAELGFVDVIHNVHTIAATVVPTEEGYVLRAVAKELPQFALTNIVTTLYGNPAVTDPGGEAELANFTNPSDCTGIPLTTTEYLDSWQHPGQLNPDGSPDVNGPGWTKAVSTSPPVTGCNTLHFAPTSFTSTVDTPDADHATGLSIDLQLPQNETPEAPVTPPLKDATVTLPAGVIVNPAAANGLGSCSPSQIGWTGNGGASGHMPLFTLAAPACPDASKIGTLEVTSPLLANPLAGAVYLATQDQNPFGSLLAGYIVIDDPKTGTIVKIAGRLSLNEQTGQITGTFDENPQLPFSDLKLRFFGGVRGGRATPESCGAYATTSELEPWSAPESGPNAKLAGSFAISEGCTPGFSPAFSAGTTNPQAASYAPFTMSFSRQDGEQELSGLTVSLPPGLVGKLAGVAQCSEAQIAAATANPSGAAEQANPSCPAASQIGTVEAAAGVGSQPFTLGGSAYLTGPYKGAPYGIAVVVPAVTGPFDLGTVVVRAALFISPTDAHVTVLSDPFPTIIDRQGDGFPIRMRSVSVSVNRSGFTLNPTSCNTMAVNATLTSSSGTVAPVSSRFQALGCGELPFHPGFSVYTQAITSKKSGASLQVKVSSSNGQANIGKVRVELPKQLPSRLTTLQKACLASVFNANPASCPPESLVGTAIAATPLLNAPLTGPVYIVSHGGAAFPDTEVVLQGEGIELILDGNTDIKKGITISTFNTVPDAPVSKFELTLPEGPHSILASFLPAKAKYSMCGQALNMPTTITGQNGATSVKTTKVSVTGCPKKHKAVKHRKAKRHKKASSRKKR
jgi:hypothetical protein